MAPSRSSVCESGDNKDNDAAADDSEAGSRLKGSGGGGHVTIGNDPRDPEQLSPRSGNAMPICLHELGLPLGLPSLIFFPVD